MRSWKKALSLVHFGNNKLDIFYDIISQRDIFFMILGLSIQQGDSLMMSAPSASNEMCSWQIQGRVLTHIR